MDYNITGANPKFLDPTHRVKTGDFRDAFAREATRRRNEARTSKGPLFNGKGVHTKPYNERKRPSWIPCFSRTTEDEERPRGKLSKQSDEHSDLRVHRMRIPIAWSRIPIGGEKDTLFLAMDENSQLGSPGLGSRTLHWVHMQHCKGIEFDTFKSTALDGIDLPLNAKNMIKSWISDIYSLQAQRIFGGKALDSCFQKQRLSSVSGQSLVCAFFAVPYLLLSENCQSVADKKANTDLHPIRALVQSAYRTDSSFTREKSQAVRKVLDLEGNALVYVPQLWGLIIGDYYLVTCAASQLHTHRQSPILPLPLEKFPPTMRLVHEDGSTFYLNLMECPTWFDFVIRIHHIYSCWLKRHIDAEKCRFCDAETGEALTAASWPSLLYKARAYGVCVTVIVVLNTQQIVPPELDHENEAYFIEPDTDTRTWVRVSKRFIDVETLAAFNLPWEEDKNDSTMIIIKTYLDVDFTEILFEHTRRSRRMREEDEVRDLPVNEPEDGKSVRDHKDRHQTGPAWHWPGCYEKDPADELRRAEGEMFWAPKSSWLDGLSAEVDNCESPDSTHDPSGASINSSRLSTDSRPQTTIPPYLSWPLASDVSAPSRSQGQKAVTRVPESQKARHSKRDSPLVPVKFLYAVLQEEEAFKELPRSKKADLVELQMSFFGGMPTASYHPEIALCNTLCDVVDHFLPDGMECLLKDKIYGGLHTILKECFKASEGTKLIRLPLLKDFTDRSLKLLKLSGEIRAGIQTDTSRLLLLTAHIDCLKELCRAISQLCCSIQQSLSPEPDYMGTRPETSHPNPDSLHKTSDLDIRTDNISMAVSKIEDQKLYRSTSPQSGGTGSWEGDIPAPSHGPPSRAASVLSERSIGTTTSPRRWRKVPRNWAPDDTESDTEPENTRNPWVDGCQALKRAEDLLIESKYSIICTLIETNPLDIDDYFGVGPSRIASSIFEHICFGLSDLEGAGSFRLEEVYRQYSSQLRIKVRDKPTRTLLDDLDLLEEELESILAVIEKQKTLLRSFTSFVDDHMSKSKRGPKDVLQNCIRELDDKAALYSEMNFSIEQLRRRVVRQVDLQQDNNSKAILVFTIVTVVFLPLSFMTSYLGMNTRDIRDMDRDQWLFWAIAAPLTLFIVGVCMVVAYEGERIRDVITENDTNKRKKDVVSGPETGNSPDANEEYTIGWVSAAPIEMAAAKGMLDEEHGNLQTPPQEADHNTYLLGSMRGFNVVIVCLPRDELAASSAAVVATDMLFVIPHYDDNDTRDICLGDVAIARMEAEYQTRESKTCHYIHWNC
ncbi:hypothetical protein ABOM_009626 [Aspergillus bombycis]|uniref:CorA family metal ion transporter n=1 Tax=Aspergillus bombycis TaxID=109264 RepID=A0A1F7ZQT0_9EURO|nr:hypothetical protein ABOM_009626 [Aspergillus bombycis]OGM41814.1 hypothetical protein ABOM_009626 [Aspergillus bombycis]